MSSHLVGREGDLATLTGYLDETMAGRGRVVVVSGEAGMGKTRLCEELASLAGPRGAGMAWTACSETGELPALWPLRQLLAQLGASPPAPVDESAHHDPVAARVGWFEGVVDALRRAGDSRPRLVVLDDVQWADEASLRLLAFGAPLLRTIPVLLVLTRRDEQVVPARRPLLRELDRHARLLPLSGLGVEQVDALVEAATGRRVGSSVVKVLHRGTGGNPLFIREVSLLLDRQGRLESLAGHDVLPVTSTISAIQAGRLSEIGDDCLRLLGVAAVVGEEWSLDIVEEVAGTAHGLGSVLVDEALSAGVIGQTTPGRFCFRHPLMRSILQEDLGSGARTALHGVVASTLDERRRQGSAIDPATLAYHYLEAGPGPLSDRAVAVCREASSRAMEMLAYEEAVGLLARALDLAATASQDTTRCELLLVLGEARAATGDRAAAREAFMGAAEDSRRQGRHDLLARAALGLSPGDGFEVAMFDLEQMSLLEEALSGLEPASPEHAALRAWCQARLSVALALTGQDERRVALSDAAVASARQAEDPGALAHALASRCDSHAGPADVEMRLSDSSEIVALSRAGSPGGDGARSGQRSELLGRRLRLVALLEAGDVAGADAEIAGFARVADRLRHPVHQWYVPMWRAMRALMEGRLDDHREMVEEADRLGRAAQSANSAVLLMALRWFALLEQAEWSQAADMFGGFLADEPVAEFGIQALPSVALHYATSGRRAEAAALIDANVDALAGAPVDSEWLPMMIQVVDVVAILGGHDLGTWLYDTVKPFDGRWVIEGIGAVDRGPVSLWLGRLAVLLGRTPEAVDHFENALRRTRAVGASLLVARTLRDWGFALDDEGRLEEALVAYRTMGMPRRVEEIEAHLASLSVAGSVPVTDPATKAASSAAAASGRNRPAQALASSDLLVREGDLWALSYGGRVARIRDSKGVRDIARLVAEPGREVAAVDLAGAPGTDGRRLGGDLGSALDDQARDSYRRRLADIEVELDEADHRADDLLSAKLQDERAALVAQLSAAFGLGGRARRRGDPVERARTAVTARIRDAIRRIEAVHPELGRHLSRSVRTGAFCSYDP